MMPMYSMFANNHMIPAKPESLSRPEIRAAFKRHRGAAIRLAEDLGINRSRISDWFGKRYRDVNPEVVAAIRQRAAELINAERAHAKKEGA